MGPTCGPPGADRTQVSPMLAPWYLLSGLFFAEGHDMQLCNVCTYMHNMQSLMWKCMQNIVVWVLCAFIFLWDCYCLVNLPVSLVCAKRCKRQDVWLSIEISKQLSCIWWKIDVFTALDFEKKDEGGLPNWGLHYLSQKATNQPSE